MRFYGKAEQSAKRILSLFESGDIPKALAPIFIRRHDDVPCRRWSWHNQLLVALAGHDDARGYRQWQEAGRFVKKGEHGFPILVPIHVRREAADDETGQTETKLALVGFKAQIVFGHAQTNGKPLEGQQKAHEFIQALPLIHVAKSWGLSVSTYSGQHGKPLGWYRPKQAIALGVENLATWAHELCHAADDRLGNLKDRGRHWQSEVVAELGGAVLLSCIGLEHDADSGGCWEYIQAYTRDAKLEPITACSRVLKRTCDAVALVLNEYETLQAQSTERQVA
jgi:antirestriction protein ArdC